MWHFIYTFWLIWKQNTYPYSPTVHTHIIIIAGIVDVSRPDQINYNLLYIKTIAQQKENYAQRT